MRRTTDAEEAVVVKIEQLQDSIVNVKSEAELVAVLIKQPEIRDFIFRRSEYPDDSVFVQSIYSRFQNAAFDTLMAETRRVFGDLSDLERQFGRGVHKH